MSVTKFASAAQRSTINSCRALVIWIFGLITGGERFNLGQFFAFSILSFGTLVYNEILVVPVNFMRRNTKKARELREAKTNLADGTDDVQSQAARATLKVHL